MSVASHRPIPLPNPLRITSTLSVEWKRFKGQWKNYVKAAKVDKEEKDCQAAIFLACIGTDAYDIYSTMEFAQEEDRDDPEKLIEAFERHCVGEINEVYERYMFHRRQQEPGETFDTFVGDLRRLARTCEYGAVEESAIRDRIVLGIRDDATRKKLLQTRKLDLSKAIDICRSSEATIRQLKVITTPEEVQVMSRSSRSSSYSRRGGRGSHGSQRGPGNRSGGNRSSSGDRRPPSSDRRCRFCDRTHEPSKTACPAYNSSCLRCGKRNHWAVACRSTGNRPTRSGSSSANVCELEENDETLFALDNTENRRIYANVFVDDRKVKFLLDCGSTVNILPFSLVPTSTVLRPSRAPLRMFDKTELKTRGMFTAVVRHPRTKVEFEVEFYVTQREVPILGIDTCRKLDMLRIVEENICEVHEAVDKPRDTIASPLSPSLPPSSSLPMTRLTETEIFTRYADLFDGALGHLEGDVHLEVDSTVRPVQMPLRRMPIALQGRVEAELQKMTDEGIIEPITEPTDWVSALLILTKQSGQLRVCIDPFHLNKALKRSTYHMPTLDHILPKLANVKVFSKIDVSRAFWHLRLDDESSRLCCFQTPFGRFIWRRLAFGLKVAPEIFAARIHAALSGLKGVHCIADDLLVTGAGNDVASAQRDHDANLIALLDRCRSKGIKLNKSKFCLNEKSTTFMGYELTTSGLRPDPRKVQAITDMPIPEDRAALRRIIGMFTFQGRFLPHFSETTAVLRELLAAENEFCWDFRHTEAFNRLKHDLCNAPLLHYFQPDEEVTIQADASSRGLGAVLLSGGKVVEYTSRALTTTEMDYAMCEKEMLSCLNACEKWDSYIYGRHITVITDHKPLVAIHKKSLNAAPKRLQRMLLRLQRYDYDLVWRPTTEMILSDTLSRAFSPAANDGTKFTEQLAALTDVDADQMRDLKMIASEGTIARVQAAAASDEDYAKLRHQIAVGWPESPTELDESLRAYHTFSDELSTSCGLCWKGHRLIVPQPLRGYILERLHDAHSGINACIRRCRETVYWPGITQDIKQLVEKCQVCARHQQQAQKEPLMPYPPPTRVWERVGVDIFTFDDHDYLVCVDFLSGFFEIDRLPSKKIADVTYCLRQHFARHGLPAEVVSDNSPFGSAEFRRFATRFEFRHTTSSPYWSRGNGRAEAAVKCAKKLLIKARESGEDPFLALLEWRNTPSEQLGPSPAQLLFGRRTRTRLPTAGQLLDTPTSHAASAALAVAKDRQAFYYNRNAKERPPLSVGQTVRVKYNDKESEWRKAEVADVLPYRSYNVRFADGTVRRRNSKHIRFSAENPTVYEYDADENPIPSSASASQDVRPNIQRGASKPTPHGSSLNSHHATPSVKARNVVQSTGLREGGAPTLSPTVTRSGRVVKRPARYDV